MVKLCLLFSLLASFAYAQQPPKIKITPLTKGFYIHTTFRTWQGTLVPSNGIIAQTDEGVVLVDTGWDVPDDQNQTEQLLDWIEQNLHQPVRMCIVTHFHDDRVGGIATLRKAGVRVVSTPLTAESAAKKGYERPEGILSNDTTLVVGKLPIRCFFPGPGHSFDNIVVYFPTAKLLHGGCFVKSYAAMGLGNLSDANLNEWANSIRRLQRTFPNPKFVIPGHDEWDQISSLENTLRLLKMKK
ncbi:MAG: subclass B1 metallo-beta-lactamase [Cytophagales bacterium]|nr:MAG: subclass B1 metallo-beta-lactamase [Cytophagales bacterium]